MPPHAKYARIECERRFLLDRFPGTAKVARIRHITDRYLDGTRLRLREQRDEGGQTVFKLTQKVPIPDSGAQQGWITTMYLAQEEFRVLSQISGKTLTKTRYSVPPFGIDVFGGTLEGLVLAEAEFDSPTAAAALALPSFIVREVTEDDRFTGGRLVEASRQDILTWLLDYGIALTAAPL